MRAFKAYSRQMLLFYAEGGRRVHAVSCRRQGSGVSRSSKAAAPAGMTTMMTFNGCGDDVFSTDWTYKMSTYEFVITNPSHPLVEHNSY